MEDRIKDPRRADTNSDELGTDLVRAGSSTASTLGLIENMNEPATKYRRAHRIARPGNQNAPVGQLDPDLRLGEPMSTRATSTSFDARVQ